MKLIFLGLLMFQSIYSQKPGNQGQFIPPVDFPLYLSGNFGELRADHFHSGIDIKTQGVTGKKVFAVDDGYVSRIKIQTLGYGNSIYISHPGGKTSVYGHLERYNDSITAYVKNYQYQRKTHTLDIYPDKETFRVKKGDLIAYSGNSGSSGGPHLHFELRGTGSQHPLNVLLYNFPVKDNIPPKIKGLYVYPLSETNPGAYPSPKSISLSMENGIYKPSQSDTILLKGTIGLGIEASDYLNDSSNPCGIYSLELRVDDNPVFVFKLDEFDFSKTSYINAHADYHALMESNRKIHLLYRKPNDLLGLYPLLLDDGKLSFTPGEIKKIEILVSDAYGNTSKLNFYVKGSAAGYPTAANDSTAGTLFSWESPNYFENAQVQVGLPARSLYDDCLFNYSRTNKGLQSVYPYTHYIGDPLTPIGKAGDISISATGIPEELRSKTVIANISGNNKPGCLSSTVKGDRISAKFSKFGMYTLLVDTIAPRIVPLNFKAGSDVKTLSSLRFNVTDYLSGIADYQGFIDNNWVLFEYDPKNDLVSYTFDPERLKSGGKHELELYIKDNVGNLKLYHAAFIW